MAQAVVKCSFGDRMIPDSEEISSAVSLTVGHDVSIQAYIEEGDTVCMIRSNEIGQEVDLELRPATRIAVVYVALKPTYLEWAVCLALRELGASLSRKPHAYAMRPYCDLKWWEKLRIVESIRQRESK